MGAGADGPVNLIRSSVVFCFVFTVLYSSSSSSSSLFYCRHHFNPFYLLSCSFILRVSVAVVLKNFESGNGAGGVGGAAERTTQIDIGPATVSVNYQLFIQI